ncbi:MAG: universal stress protein [Flavobacteriaceae bacterium]|nr:universal stress protein [Flavobacteriaceae bacterium]
MKKILIPTDFSDNAWDALIYAIRLYDDIPCRFFVLNTYEVMATGVNTTIHSSATKKLYEILREDSQKGLEKIEKYLNDHLLNDKHEYEIISKYGSLTSVVKDLINKENIDLIIMGTTGASGIKKVFMGSNAMRLIKNISDCPIIAVPKDYEFEEPELISFATDLNKLFTAEDLNPLYELLLIHDLNLEILHVHDEAKLSDIQKENIELIKHRLDSHNVSYKGIDLISTVSKSINEYTKTNKVDLICFANYEHTFIEKLTHEPIIKKVGFQTQVPLLIIPI